jgi:predicted DNA-binding transcriptional regulator AlpA
MQPLNPAERHIMRRDEVEQKTGFKRSHIYNLMKAGRFPQCRRISGIANEAFWLDVELHFDPLDHRLGALDFCGSMSRCGFHIHDHAVLGID